MVEDTLDKVSELGEKKLAQLEADEQAALEQKQADEAKGASAGKSSTEKIKTEGEAGDKEEKIELKPDVVILDSDDKDLTEPEQLRKQELIKEADLAKTPEEKMKDWQDKTQERIDALIGETKAAKAEKEELVAELARLKGELEKSGTLKSQAELEKLSDTERFAVMIDEDKELSRETRREMSEDELETFLLEDYAKAQEWLIDRKFRRINDTATKAKSGQAKDNINEGAEKFFTEFPACNQDTRHRELVAEGKTDKEAIEILKGEVPDFKLFMDIMGTDQKYLDPVEGPKLLLAEMTNRKSGKTYTAEEVETMKKDAIAKEQERIGSIDQGISNSAMNEPNNPGTPLYKQGLALFIKAGKRKGQVWTEKDYRDTLDYGAKQRASSPL